MWTETSQKVWPQSTYVRTVSLVPCFPAFNVSTWTFNFATVSASRCILRPFASTLRQFERLISSDAPSHLLSKCQKLRARAWSLWISCSEQKVKTLSKRFKTIKTVVRQLNWNPRVLCASKHLNHLSFKGETHQKDLKPLKLPPDAPHRTARSFVCDLWAQDAQASKLALSLSKRSFDKQNQNRQNIPS